MSVENEDILLVPEPEESSRKMQKQSRITYTREFLLSLSNLEVCKNLPSGFDESILSEFEDSTTSYGNQDRPRLPGSSSLQGFRPNDYGSSPPTRGDLGNFPRATHRWDSRSSGRSETDSQSDKDSDSGTHYGNQYRRPWQSSQHDGLLGSGSFPRPSGYRAGASVARHSAGDHNQLNRSNEPYHPPRPYRAAPHSRRETNDSVNNETFSSTESTSEDRVEEERKRRAEFELMRKEQRKVLQEKLKSSSGKPKEDPLTELLDDPIDDNNRKEVIDPLLKPPLHHDSGRVGASSQAPLFRPLVPPGFASSVAEKSSGAKPPNNSNTAEAGKFVRDDDHQDEKESAQLMGSVKQKSETATHSSYKGARDANLLSPMMEESLEITNRSAAGKFIGNDDFMQLDTENTSAKHTEVESSQSTSILEKLFGTAFSGDSGGGGGGGGAKLVEVQDAETPDVMNPHGVHSSKFAHWFLEEGKQPIENVSQGKSKGLLSLIVGEKSGTMMTSDAKATQDPNSEACLPIVASIVSSSSAELIGASEHLNKDKMEVMPQVLTCEDLEQSILSGFNGSNPHHHSLEQVYCVSDVDAEHPKTVVENSASQHLLSLLQKGTGSKNVAPSSILDQGTEPCGNNVSYGNVSDGSVDKLNSSGNTLTLETLFGTAFMQELQSVGAPASQRNFDGSTRPDTSSGTNSQTFPVSDDGLYPPGLERVCPQSGDNSCLAMSDSQQHIKPDLAGHYIGFDAPRLDSELSRLGSIFGAYDGHVEARLPEEDSLIAVGGPVNAPGSMFTSGLGVANLVPFSSSSDQQVDIAEKLAALAVLKDQQPVVREQGGLPFISGPFDMVKSGISYDNHHSQPSPIHFHPQQMNHRTQLFHHLEPHPAHIDPQLKYLAPERIVHPDGRTRHQFPPNMVHPHHDPGPVLPEFNHSIPHPLLQQMQMPSNLPHVSRSFSGFPGIASMPLHHSNSPLEHNQMHGFPFGPRQPNFNGVGLRPPGLDLGCMGNNHPEALQRLLEMELRSNQMHPFPPGSHARPMYGHDLDTGFRY